MRELWRELPDGWQEGGHLIREGGLDLRQEEMWKVGRKEEKRGQCCPVGELDRARRTGRLGTEGSRCPDKALHSVPTPGASTDRGCPGGICVRSCTGTQSHSWCGQGTAWPGCPPQPPARRPTELNCHIGKSKVNTNR